MPLATFVEICWIDTKIPRGSHDFREQISLCLVVGVCSNPVPLLACPVRGGALLRLVRAV